jgi:hypothetical protein
VTTLSDCDDITPFDGIFFCNFFFTHDLDLDQTDVIRTARFSDFPHQPVSTVGGGLLVLTPAALAEEEKSAPPRLSLSEVVSVRDVTDEFRASCQSTAAQLVLRLVEVWRDLPAAQEVWHPLLALLPGVQGVVADP